MWFCGYAPIQVFPMLHRLYGYIEFENYFFETTGSHCGCQGSDQSMNGLTRMYCMLSMQWIWNYENGSGRCRKILFLPKMQLHLKSIIFTYITYLSYPINAIMRHAVIDFCSRNISPT